MYFKFPQNCNNGNKQNGGTLVRNVDHSFFFICINQILLHFISKSVSKRSLVYLSVQLYCNKMFVRISFIIIIICFF